MKNLNKNTVNNIIKKSKTNDGVILNLEIEGESEKYEVSLKIRKDGKGSYLFYFGLENKGLNVATKLMKRTFSKIFSDINFKKEFQNNLDWEDGHFKTWAYLGDEKDVIEFFLHLQYDQRKWKIVNIK